MIRIKVREVTNYSWMPPSFISENDYNSLKRSYLEPEKEKQKESKIKKGIFDTLGIVLYPFALATGLVESNKNWKETNDFILKYEADLKSLIQNNREYNQFINEYRMKYDPQYQIDMFFDEGDQSKQVDWNDIAKKQASLNKYKYKL